MYLQEHLHTRLDFTYTLILRYHQHFRQVVILGCSVHDINRFPCQSLNLLDSRSPDRQFKLDYTPTHFSTMFTPVNTSLGALLLFQGSSGLLFHNGAVFGISSLVSGCVFNPSRDNVPIVLGMVSSILPVYMLSPSLIPSYPLPPQTLASAATTMGVGFLLGWGTKVRTESTYVSMQCIMS